jgi:hypothetical protein
MKHIAIEANCFFNIDRDENECKPECCIYDPGNVSINCLMYDKNQYCPFLVFGHARTTILLTEQKGNVVNADCFWGDLKLSEAEWIKQEKKWIEKQNDYINKLNGN